MDRQRQPHVVDGTVTWTDLGVPTTNLASGAYVINQGMQLGRAGKADNVILTSDSSGVLLDFNGDGQLTENVAWATVTLNPLTSCQLRRPTGATSPASRSSPRSCRPAWPPTSRHRSRMLDECRPRAGHVRLRGPLHPRHRRGAGRLRDHGSRQGDNNNGHFTQIERLIVNTLHVGWPNAILRGRRAAPVISPTFSTDHPELPRAGCDRSDAHDPGHQLRPRCGRDLLQPGDNTRPARPYLSTATS